MQTIHRCFCNLQRSKSPNGCADIAKDSESGRKGSNVYEVNQWLWRFGRGKPRLGGLSVSETDVQQMTVMQEGAARHGYATRTKGRHAPKARRPSEE